MKYIKPYKNYKNIKRYVIVQVDDDLYFSEILEINIKNDNIATEDLGFYNDEKSKTLIFSNNNSYTDYYLDFLDKLLFTSDNYEEAHNFFIEHSEIQKNIKKYNL